MHHLKEASRVSLTRGKIRAAHGQGGPRKKKSMVGGAHKLREPNCPASLAWRHSGLQPYLLVFIPRKCWRTGKQTALLLSPRLLGC